MPAQHRWPAGGRESKSVFGQPARVTGLCFAEWEEQSPWPSLAERRGFSRQDEVVTAHGGKGTLPLADINTEDAADLVYLLAKSVAYPMGNKFLEPTASNGQIVLAVNPAWAKRLGAAFPDVADMEALLFEHAWQPVELWPKANRRILEEKGRVDSAGRVRLADRSEQFVVVVCGGQGGLHAVCLPSWGESEMQSAASARRVGGRPDIQDSRRWPSNVEKMRRWALPAAVGLVLVALLPPAAVASLGAPGASQPAAQGSGAVGPDCPSKVMAFYYGWYGGAQDGYRHWANATGEAQYQYDPPATVSAADYPRLGAYGSHDPAAVDQHLAWAREAGIDTLISSWWGPVDAGGKQSYEDASLGLLLQRIAATHSGIKASAYLETWALFHGPQFGAGFFTDPDNFSPQGRQAARDKAVAWITYLLTTYGTQEGFQHVVKNGQKVPVVFVYTAALFDPVEWQMIFDQVRKATGIDAYYDGDVEGADFQAQARAFDGLHVYTPVPLTAEGDLSFAARVSDPHATAQNPAARVTDPATVGSDYQAWAAEARALGRGWAATVIPGFDDRRVRNPSFWVSRTHGDQLTYDEFWQLSLRSRPDWVLITTFNEWHEGTEIEPSQPWTGQDSLHGTLQYPGYETKYLADTSSWAARVHRCQA